MIGGKAQGSQTPTAMGTMLQASTYGMAIPTIYGMTQSPLLAIWASNLRMGSGSTKKLKQFFKKQPVYVEGVDFLVGANPVLGINQLWINGGTIPLTVKTVSFTTDLSTSFTISDPYFYSIIGITRAQAYSETFNDYGAPGPATVSGTAQVPLWNLIETGPDPTNANSYRKYPLSYLWEPSLGSTFYIPNYFSAGGWSAGDVITVTYYALMAATSYQSPLAKYRLAFENELGNGDEYSENNASAEQIIYPMFAGVGSPDIDLGTSATMPQIQAEVKGKWGYWPTGDADFADMIEDVFKSGIAQAAIGASTTGTVNTGLEHGLSGYNYPGCVQKAIFTDTEAFTIGPRSYPLPNTAGNFLVVCAGAPTATTLSISDSAGNTWTPIFSAGLGVQAWYCKAVGGANTVTIDGLSYDWEITLLEIGGVDTFDSAVVGASGNASITTTNQSGFPAYVLGLGLYNSGGSWPSNFSTVRWSSLASVGTLLSAFDQRTNYPATISLQVPVANAPNGMCLLAFKCVNPPSYPAPIGDFMDLDSLNLVRAQCQANGLYGSLTMTAQQSASDWLKTLYQAANAAPVLLGSKLFSFPYSEVSAAGNGAVYNSPTASGPVANLDADNGDFVGSDPPIKVTTASRVDLPNVLQMQCISRTSNYNPIVVEQPDAASIALYGVRKADPVINNAVQDASIARMLLGIAVRNNQYGGDVYEFTVHARWCLLRPMNLITVTDRLAGIVKFPVRLSSVNEQEDGSFQCKAMPFIYGLNAPNPLPVSTQSQPTPSTGADPGQPNVPVFIEPVPRLAGNPNSYELWIVVSSSNANYAGCQTFVSTDGGASYNPLGDPILGNGTTGVSTADWPVAADPDTTNNLPLDLTESDGVLASYALSDENAFKYPCYVAGGGGSTIPYELMAYAVATLTAANKYTLEATGAGNELRRAVFGAPAPGEGCDHPSGSRFAFLSPDGTGILKVAMDTAWIGVELYFKFVPVNSFGSNGQQTLANATAYPYTPMGGAGAINPGGVPVQAYTNNPAIALSQPTATSIALAAVAVTFGNATVHYAARTVTIPAPSTPTWYYFTIADPAQAGESGSPTLTATCQTSNALVGVQGNTYMGAILALPAGGATQILAGGWPAPQTFQVGA